MKKLLGLCLALMLIMAQAAVAQEADLRSLEHDGIERTYHLYAPDTADKLLIVSHGFASSGKAMEAITGLNKRADAAGFAIAYPNSEGFYWDDGRNETEYAVPPVREPVDDLGFLEALAVEITSEMGIASDAVYLTGMGNGGTMALRAACEIPDQFAGVALVGALMWNYQVEQCNATTGQPIDILFIQGERDVHYPLDGRTFQTLEGDVQDYKIESAQTTVNFWTERNACDPQQVQAYHDNALQVLSACGEDTTTAYFQIAGANHAWQRTGYRIDDLGIDTSEIMLSFFAGDDRWLEASGETTAATGFTRSWVLYVPSTYDASTPTPLMIQLHGRTVDGISQAYTSNMNEIAEREGFITLYPEGVNNEWNYVRDVPGYSFPLNDEEFLFNLQDDLAEDLNIDPNRVYVAGLSNGGFMTQRLACTGNERYAAFASVAATAPEGLQYVCADRDPVPMLLIHGTLDRIVPWDGVTRPDNPNRYISLPMNLTSPLWSAFNECAETVQEDELPQGEGEETRTLIFTFEDCADGSAFQIYAVLGGGHVWPGVRDTESELLGAVTMDFNASEVIWDFFQQYTLDMRSERQTPSPFDVQEQETTQPDGFSGAADLINQLQNGGFTILINPFSGTSEEDCEALTEGAEILDEEGQERSIALREAFESLGITVSEIIATDDCLAQASALTSFGRVDTTVANEQTAMGLKLTVIPPAGTNTVIFGDASLMLQGSNQRLQPGTALIFLPLEENGIELMSPVPPSGWSDLAQFDLEAQSND